MAKTVKTEAEIFKEEFKKKVRDEAKMLYRKTLEEVSDRHKFVAVAYAVKDIVIDQWIATQKAYEKADAKTVQHIILGGQEKIPVILLFVLVELKCILTGILQ